MSSSDQLNDKGRTELHLVASSRDNNNLVKVQQLVENGADVNAQDNDGKTALHYASSIVDNLEVVKYLVEKKADLNVQDNRGRTPLHYASEVKDNLDVVKCLVENEADFNIRDNDSRTALIYINKDEEYINGQGPGPNHASEIGVLTLFVVCAMKAEMKFKLASNMADVGALDDVVLILEKTGKYQFVQLKFSTQDEKQPDGTCVIERNKLTKGGLLTNKEFNLVKYFLSYYDNMKTKKGFTIDQKGKRIYNNLGEKFTTDQIDKLIILTNYDLDKNSKFLVAVNDKSILNRPYYIINRKETQFVEQLKDEIVRYSTARLLIKSIKSQKSLLSVSSSDKTFLQQNVLDVDNDGHCSKFKDDFINKQSKLPFRETFMKLLENKEKSFDDLKVKLAKNPMTIKEDEINNLIEDIDQFLSKLAYVFIDEKLIN
jgi:DNA-directed RNA polymerase subunit F